MRWKCLTTLALAVLVLLVSSTAAHGKQYLLPLHDGKLWVRDINSAISGELHVFSLPTSAEINLNGPEGADFLCAVNACLWHGSSLQTSPAGAVLNLEPPVAGTCLGMRRMTRIIAAERAPAATAAQVRRWGLSFPERIDPNRRLIVLIHGLDADRNDCIPLGQSLRNSGYRVAYFSYPGDQPIDDSAALLPTA